MQTRVIKKNATPPITGRRWAYLCLFSTAMIMAIMLHSSTLFAQQRSPAHQKYCLELESKLAKDYYQNSTTFEDRTKLRMEMRNVERIYHRLSNEAERRGCYSYYIFSKELRRTPRCIRIDRKIRSAKRELQKLNNQLRRAAEARSNNKSRQNAIIRALARNKCGLQYEREARRQNNWFGNGFFGYRPQYEDPQNDSFRFATHRTLCVRLCDGYYFPLSFATTTNRFTTDEQTCRASCAAPARLYTHPNPGGDASQMLSINGEPYDNLRNAWRYRKEYVKGCSCKASEYNPELLYTTKKAKENEDQTPAVKEKKPAKKQDGEENEVLLQTQKKVGALNKETKKAKINNK